MVTITHIMDLISLLNLSCLRSAGVSIGDYYLKQNFTSLCFPFTLSGRQKMQLQLDSLNGGQNDLSNSKDLNYRVKTWPFPKSEKFKCKTCAREVMI